MKLSIIATIENVLTHIANSIYQDQTDRIVSVGSVSTVIESVLSTEWQCLKNKNGMYTESNHDFKLCHAFDTYL